jgi:hypothetical protein
MKLVSTPRDRNCTCIIVVTYCRWCLVVGESRPFIFELLKRLPDVIRLLEPQQVQVFYEAVGYVIASSSTREVLIEQLMQLPNFRVCTGVLHCNCT